MSEENNATDPKTTSSIGPESAPPTVPATIQRLLKLHRRQTIATYIAATVLVSLFLFAFSYSMRYGWGAFVGGVSSLLALSLALSVVMLAIYAGLAWHETKQKLGDMVTNDELTWARNVIENYTPEFSETLRAHAIEMGGVNRDIMTGLANHYRRKHFTNAFGHVRPTSDPAVNQLLAAAGRGRPA